MLTTADIEVRAAVARTPGEALRIETLRLRDLAPNEVLVKNRASGICHTDLSVSAGILGVPLPVVPGHEGVGEVLECGEAVTSVAVGDHVIVALMSECGECRACRSAQTNACVTTVSQMSDPIFRDDSGPVPAMAFGATFATHTIAPETALVVLPRDVPFDVAALVGCGVSTGVGAVRYTARVEEGSSVLVFGLGSIGLNVIQAAKLAGAGSIIALDTKSHRRDLAAQFGATETLNPLDLGDDIVGRLVGDTGGVDYAFECVGDVGVLQTALAATNPYWGTCVAVGVPPFSDAYNIPASTFLLGRTLRGTFIGNVKPRTQLPSIVEDYRAGRLDLDSLITGRIGLDEIEDGFRRVREGAGIRTVIVHE